MNEAGVYDLFLFYEVQMHIFSLEALFLFLFLVVGFLVASCFRQWPCLYFPEASEESSGLNLLCLLRAMGV